MVKNNNELQDYKSLVTIETFDGVRKSNARKIFGILLIIIVIDFGIDLIG